MKKLSLITIFLLAISFYSVENYAQCTDGGICQLGGHMLEGEAGEKFNISTYFKYGFSGKEDDVQYYSFVLDGYYSVFEKSSVQSFVDSWKCGVGHQVIAVGYVLFGVGLS